MYLFLILILGCNFSLFPVVPAEYALDKDQRKRLHDIIHANRGTGRTITEAVAPWADEYSLYLDDIGRRKIYMAERAGFTQHV